MWSMVRITITTEASVGSGVSLSESGGLPERDDGNLLIYNAHLFTGIRHTEAVLIRNGIVECAGDNLSVLRAAAQDDRIRRIDAEGRLVLPGMVDAHMHLVETGVEMMMGQVRGYASIRKMVDDMRKRCLGIPFLISGGWDEENFVEHRLPDRYDLDMISADKPVMLFRFCHHVVSVNSFVIEKCGLERAPDIPGGITKRDESGSVTGVLIDRAMDNIAELRRELISSVAGDAVRVAVEYALSRGLTTLMPLDADSVEFETCMNMASGRELKCRLRMFLTAQYFATLGESGYAGNHDDMFHLCGVKLFADGSFGGRTAHLSAPYEDDPTSGLCLMDEEELVKHMTMARERGMMVAAHAIGDRAIESVLAAAEKTGLEGQNLRLEHVAFTPPGVIQKIGSFRPTVVVQPHFLVGDWWLPDRLGKRCSDCYLFRTFTSMGLRPVGSSDSPVEPLDPWTGIITAVDRGKHAGVRIADLTAGEALDPETAVLMYTAWAGAASGEEHKLGMLEPGSYGDAVMMAEKSIESAMSHPAVLMTVVAGRVRYKSADCV